MNNHEQDMEATEKPKRETKRLLLLALGIIAVVPLTAACVVCAAPGIYFYAQGQQEASLTAETREWTPAPIVVELIPTDQQPILPTVTTPEDRASVAGRYRLKPPDYEEDYDQQIEADYYLVLELDGTVRYEEQPIGDAEIVVIARGTWARDATGAIVTITELFGEPLDFPEILRYAYLNGFPVVIDFAVGDELYDLKEAEFTIGAGERHPLVSELHRRLAKLDYLGFVDPGDDLYTESTRKAVVAFQEAMGLLPNGEVTAATWVLLGNPPPPLPTPQPAPSVDGSRLGVPNLDDLPTHTSDGKPILYLTFDDGPNATFTPQILNTLATYNANATFFVLGKAVSAQPDLVRQTAQAGHYVANHTFSHPSLEGVTAEEFMEEVEDTKKAILDAAGDLFTMDHDVRYLRPPYGATDANSRQYATDLGYAVVLWDVDPQDWRRPGAKIIADHIVSSAYPGAIILMHDGGGDRAQSVAALEIALQQLSTQGYAFHNVLLP